jgi:hypothetical protein
MRYVSNTLDDWIVKPKRTKKGAGGKGKKEENGLDTNQIGVPKSM